jgi:hypothetical protein
MIQSTRLPTIKLSVIKTFIDCQPYVQVDDDERGVGGPSVVRFSLSAARARERPVQTSAAVKAAVLKAMNARAAWAALRALVVVASLAVGVLLVGSSLGLGHLKRPRSCEALGPLGERSGWVVGCLGGA